jgi:protein tyrosine phosphatase (PTP) superfamily phosphohydrolase (DUF442 family)
MPTPSRRRYARLFGSILAGWTLLSVAAIRHYGLTAATPFGQGRAQPFQQQESRPAQDAETAIPFAETEPPVSFVGPRQNLPEDAPEAYGFWSFAQPVPGVLSRSGQPLPEEFQWLKERGWKSVVNFRVDDERGEIADDALLSGFDGLGLNYLRLPISDGSPPNDEQAEAFLAFVTDPDNHPVHIHCRAGIGRTGTLTALYRYSVQRWPMEEAIRESRLFRGGISSSQKRWLEQWAERHPPGTYAPVG